MFRGGWFWWKLRVCEESLQHCVKGSAIFVVCHVLGLLALTQTDPSVWEASSTLQCHCRGPASLHAAWSLPQKEHGVLLFFIKNLCSLRSASVHCSLSVWEVEVAGEVSSFYTRKQTNQGLWTSLPSLDPTAYYRSVLVSSITWTESPEGIFSYHSLNFFVFFCVSAVWDTSLKCMEMGISMF